MSVYSDMFTCITNNPDLTDCLSVCTVVNGTAVDVMIKARDLVHAGWILIANPLYGNFKPNQQPYRTLVLSKKNDSKIDLESMKLLDDAMAVYRSAPILRRPCELPENIDKDFRYLDFVLMQETFRQTGILAAELHRTVVMPQPAPKTC